MKKRHKEKIKFTTDEMMYLKRLSKSRTEKYAMVQRAQILLMDQEDVPNKDIAESLGIYCQKVETCLKKAREMGLQEALNDLPRSGAPSRITMEARGWVVYLACEKPTLFGYAQEMWTYTLLLGHIHKNCGEKGLPVLQKLSRGELWNILNDAEIKPQKINYYLEKKDPQFEERMAEVLHVYKEVEIANQQGKPEADMEKITVSYDEKPGMQAIGNIAPDLPAQPCLYQGMGRDYEYKRYGTLSLLAAIDLHTGEIIAEVSETHKSADFVRFLGKLDENYPESSKIRIVLDNHSAHTSKETRRYLEEKPNRFEFVFTPKHGSWLNMIEIFFSKMTRTFLRGIRVNSKEELRARIYQYINEINREPVIFRWKYGMDNITI